MSFLKCERTFLGAADEALQTARHAGCIVIEKTMWNQRLFQRLATQVGLPLELRDSAAPAADTAKVVLWPMHDSSFPIRISAQAPCTEKLTAATHDRELLLYLPDDDLLTNLTAVRLLVCAAQAHRGLDGATPPWLGWGAHAFEINDVLSRLPQQLTKVLQEVKAILPTPTQALSDGHTLVVEVAYLGHKLRLPRLLNSRRRHSSSCAATQNTST